MAESQPVSIRISSSLRSRLAGTQRPDQSRAALLEELIDEGLRMREHPGIVFRGGPAGRRAALVGGPDVWEVVETLRGTGERGERAVEKTAEWGELSVEQVRAAVSYYGDFQEEIDGWIEANRAEAARVRASWERAQRALA